MAYGSIFQPTMSITSNILKQNPKSPMYSLHARQWWEISKTLLRPQYLNPNATAVALLSYRGK
jgi:hypothetical protein